MSLKSAFKIILKLQARPMTFHDISTDTQTAIRAATSNYFRALANMEDTVSIGREFVIDIDQLPTTPKRGDKLIDADFGVTTIKVVNDMVVMGQIVGYRVRVE